MALPARLTSMLWKSDPGLIMNMVLVSAAL